MNFVTPDGVLEFMVDNEWITLFNFNILSARQTIEIVYELFITFFQRKS